MGVVDGIVAVVMNLMRFMNCDGLLRQYGITHILLFLLWYAY